MIRDPWLLAWRRQQGGGGGGVFGPPRTSDLRTAYHTVVWDSTNKFRIGPCCPHEASKHTNTRIGGLTRGFLHIAMPCTGLIHKLAKLVVEHPTIAAHFDPVFSTLPVVRDLMQFSLQTSDGLYEELAVSALASLMRNTTVSQTSYLATTEGARDLSMLFRSPYASVRAGVLQLMTKAASFEVCIAPFRDEEVGTSLSTGLYATGVALSGRREGGGGGRYVCVGGGWGAENQHFEWDWLMSEPSICASGGMKQEGSETPKETQSLSQRAPARG